MRTALYLRMSRDRTGEAAGIDRQERECRALVEELGWSVVETYIDNDVSATKAKRRTHYERMLRDIEAGDIDAIVVWHTDRLYRKATDLARLVDVCKQHNTRVQAVRVGHVDLTTPSGRLVAGLLAQVATYEGEQKADRWRLSYEQARRAGKHFGGGSRLFGFTREGEIDPAEGDIVRSVVQGLLEGQSILALCDGLNSLE